MVQIIKDYKINEENINNFVSPNWQRSMRTTKIRQFKIAMNKKEFFGTILTVNLKYGKFRVINGNHRLEAIKEALNNLKEVEVILEVHRDLTDKEEKEIFTLISIETPQTLDDHLYIHRDELQIYNLMKADFPININIYSHYSGVRLKILIDAIFSSSHSSKIFDTKSVNRKESLKVARNLNKVDYNNLYYFFELYIVSVGGVLDNPLYKPMILVPLLNIYFKNKTNILLRTREKYPDSAWKDLFKNMMTDHVILSYAEIKTSREKMKDVRLRIIYLANKNRTTSALI